MEVQQLEVPCMYSTHLHAERWDCGKGAATDHCDASWKNSPALYADNELPVLLSAYKIFKRCVKGFPPHELAFSA